MKKSATSIKRGAVLERKPATSTRQPNLLGEAFALQKVPRAVRGRFLSSKKAARVGEELGRKAVEA